MQQINQSPFVRFFSENYLFDKAKNIRPDAVVFLYEKDGKVLSVSRKDNMFDFGLPGGKVEEDESPELAIIREMKEETGLDVIEPKHLVTLPEGEKQVAVYSGSISGDIQTEENHIVKFSDWEELFDGSFGKYNRVLFNYLNRQTEASTKTASESSEKDLQLWQTWKHNPNPDTLQPLMKGIEPIIKKEVGRWKQSQVNPTLIEMEAKNLAFQSLHKYNPEKSQLNTHVTNNLKKLSRYVINNQNIVRTSEDKIYDYRKYLKAKEELETELGHDVSALDVEVRMNNASKISDYKPFTEHLYSTDSELGNVTERTDLNTDPIAMNIMFDNLKPKQQFIFQHSYGYKGSPIYQNKEIAKKLGISAPAVTKQKNVIEKSLRRYQSSLENMSS